MRRSDSRVTFRFSGNDSTTVITPPASSTSHASSVAAASAAASRSRARRRMSALKTWGVWIAQSEARSSVRSTRPSNATSFTVSVIGMAAIAPSIPGSSAARQRATSSRVTSGRAAPWTTATDASGAAARAFRTDAERDSPPRTRSGPSSQPAGAATTTRSQTDPSASRLHSISGRPAQTTNALGRSAPRRSPLPPAGTIPTTDTMFVLRGGGGAVAAGVRLHDQLLQMRLGLVLLHHERVHQLGREDLLGAGVHLLLARREPLLLLPNREVANNLGELEDIT